MKHTIQNLQQNLQEEIILLQYQKIANIKKVKEILRQLNLTTQILECSEKSFKRKSIQDKQEGFEMLRRTIHLLERLKKHTQELY